MRWRPSSARGSPIWPWWTSSCPGSTAWPSPARSMNGATCRSSCSPRSTRRERWGSRSSASPRTTSESRSIHGRWWRGSSGCSAASATSPTPCSRWCGWMTGWGSALPPSRGRGPRRRGRGDADVDRNEAPLRPPAQRRPRGGDRLPAPAAVALGRGVRGHAARPRPPAPGADRARALPPPLRADRAGDGLPFPQRVVRLPRPRLLTRVALALAAVGLLPLAISYFGLVGVNRDALFDQVLNTHALAARTAAARVESFLEARLSLARGLAANRTLADPRSPAAQELLAGSLQAWSDLNVEA